MAQSKGLYGLSGSGMDIDSMVKKMMMGEQTKYDNLYKNKVSQQWKKEQYNEFYKTLTTFRFDTLSNYKQQTVLSPRVAKSGDDKIVTATANGAASEMTHDIEVRKLAQSAYLQSTAIQRDPAMNPKGIELRDLPITFPSGADPDEIILSFAISSGNTDEDKPHVISYTYKDLWGSPASGDDPGSDPMTLNDLASDINSKGGGFVGATYDNTNDTFSIYGKKGGDRNGVQISVYQGRLQDGVMVDVPSADAQNNAKILFDSLQLAKYDQTDKTLGAPMVLDPGVPIDVKGVSAEAYIDGKLYKSDTNKIIAGNINYTLNKVSPLLYDSSGNVLTYPDGTSRREETKVAITSDKEKTIEAAKKFVEDYNKILVGLNDKLYETAYKDYKPLTNDEKSAMSENEIKQWEEKAKSGLVYQDQLLKTIVDDMRSALSQSIDGVEGKYNSASAIGIVAGSYQEHGKITLDIEKLTAALEADPDAVFKILGKVGTSTSTDKEEKVEEQYDSSGIAYRLGTQMKKALDSINLRGGIKADEDDQSMLGIKIESLNEQMRKLLKSMDAKETALYKQFNAMETALASLNQQANAGSSLLGNG